MNKNNKFLQCFRPFTMDALKKGRSVKTGRCTDDPGDSVFTCFGVGEKDGIVFPRILAPTLAAYMDKEEGGGDWRKKGGNGWLSRILKAVFITNSSAEKIRKRKLGRPSSFRSETNITVNTVEISNPPSKNSVHKQKLFDNNNLGVDSNVSSYLRCSPAFTSTSLCSSCSCSRTTSNKRSLSERSHSFRSNSAESQQRQDSVQDYRKGCHGANYVGLCLLLIGLLVLIFWGKICAILYTSTWFFLVSWRARCDSPEDGIECPETDSEEYKKKVVMQGLLKRNRARGL